MLEKQYVVNIEHNPLFATFLKKSVLGSMKTVFHCRKLIHAARYASEGQRKALPSPNLLTALSKWFILTILLETIEKHGLHIGLDGNHDCSKKCSKLF